LSVDIPSGVDAATGRVQGPAVLADWTVTFHRPKPGHYLYPGRTHCGELKIASIGIPPALDDAPGFLVLEDADVDAWLPARPSSANKGDFGHVLCIAGSTGMAGAAALCGQAALRGGAGLVTLCCPEAILPTLQQLCPCAMAIPFEDERAVRAALQRKRSVAVGPGLSQKADILDKLNPLFDSYLPQVWDADALNLLADAGRKPPPQAILTPHPGEAARLLGTHLSEVVEDPVAAAEELAKQTGTLVLLKGATSVIADGVHADLRALNISGCAGLARGGSGDVLTGFIAALLAQGLSRFKAACLGAFLHGRAGEAAARTLNERSITAWDIPAHLYA